MKPPRSAIEAGLKAVKMPMPEPPIIWTCPVCHRTRAMGPRVARAGGAYPQMMCEKGQKGDNE